MELGYKLFKNKSYFMKEASNISSSTIYNFVGEKITQIVLAF